MDLCERNDGSRERRRWAAFTVSGDRNGDVYLVTAEGELDMATVGDLADELDRAAASDAKQILLDLSGVTFIDSMGIHLLVKAQRHVAQGRLRLLPVEGEVRRLLELTGVAKYLEFVSQPSDGVRG
jgi:anti-anti-sigma factor